MNDMKEFIYASRVLAAIDTIEIFLRMNNFDDVDMYVIAAMIAHKKRDELIGKYGTDKVNRLEYYIDMISKEIEEENKKEKEKKKKKKKGEKNVKS
jgi:hypothetical protein